MARHFLTGEELTAADQRELLERAIELKADRLSSRALEVVEELARHASIPVINMLTHEHHPCQALADLMTLRERFGALEELKLAYVGEGNNMARSLVIACG